jgi:hypothetical protein
VHVVASRCIARSSSGAPRGALRSGHDACRNGAQRAQRTQDDEAVFTLSVHWVKSHENRRERFFAPQEPPRQRHLLPDPHTNPKPP